MIDEISIHIRHQAVRSSLDERGRRLQAVAKAISAGHGGVAAAAGATKVARSTIGRGIKDLHEPATLTVIQPSATEFLRDIARDPIRRRATYYSWLATFCQSSEFSTFGFYIPVLFVILGVSSLVGTNVILLFVWLFGTLAAWVAPLMIPRVGHKGIGEIGFGCVLTALLIAAYALYTAAVGQANATLTVAIFPLAGLLGAIFLLPEVFGYESS